MDHGPGAGRPARSVKTSGKTPYFSLFSADSFSLPGHPGAGAARKLTLQTPITYIFRHYLYHLYHLQFPGARCANADAYQSGRCPSSVKLVKLSTENFVGWVACERIRCYIISRNITKEYIWFYLKIATTQ